MKLEYPVSKLPLLLNNILLKKCVNEGLKMQQNNNYLLIMKCKLLISIIISVTPARSIADSYHTRKRERSCERSCGTTCRYFYKKTAFLKPPNVNSNFNNG